MCSAGAIEEGGRVFEEGEALGADDGRIAGNVYGLQDFRDARQGDSIGEFGSAGGVIEVIIDYHREAFAGVAEILAHVNEMAAILFESYAAILATANRSFDCVYIIDNKAEARCGGKLHNVVKGGRVKDGVPRDERGRSQSFVPDYSFGGKQDGRFIAQVGNDEGEKDNETESPGGAKFEFGEMI